MPRIMILPERAVFARHPWPADKPLHVEVIALSEIDGIYTLRCTGDQIDECPGNIEAGDTWSNFEQAVEAAAIHVALHEQRVCATCAGRMAVAYGHAADGEFVQTATCQSCGATEVRP